MSEHLQRLYDEIRALAPDERAGMMAMLRDLDALPEPDVVQVWLDEAGRRFRAMEAEAEEEQNADDTASRSAVADLLKKR